MDKKSSTITIIVTVIFAIGIVFFSFRIGFGLGVKKSIDEIKNLRSELLQLDNFDPESRYISMESLEKLKESTGVDAIEQLENEGVFGRVYSVSEEDGNNVFMMVTGQRRGVIRVLVDDDTDLIEDADEGKLFEEMAIVMVLGSLLEEGDDLYIKAEIVKVVDEDEVLK